MATRGLTDGTWEGDPLRRSRAWAKDPAPQLGWAESVRRRRGLARLVHDLRLVLVQIEARR